MAIYTLKKFFYKNVMWIGVACCIVAFATLIIAVSIQQTDNQPFEFAIRQKVSALQTLRMSFPEEMNKESVAANMSVDPPITGQKLWEGNTLVYKPSVRLSVGKTYRFLFSRRTLTKSGQTMGRDLSFDFIVTGAPTVTTHFPSDKAKSISPDSKITILFDRPMIALGMVSNGPVDQKTAEWPVVITPAVEGRWRWLSTMAIEFIPSKGLTPSTVYSITVPKDIMTANGDTTENEITWTFETIRPAVIATNPQPDSNTAGPTTQPSVTFNQEMDIVSAEKAITFLVAQRNMGAGSSIPSVKQKMSDAIALLQSGIVPAGSQQVGIRSLQYGMKEMNGKKVIDKTQIVIVPSKKLDMSKIYIIKVAQGTRGARGNLGSTQDYVFRMFTAGPLSIVDAKNEYGVPTLTFSNPLTDTTLKNGISIQPEPAIWKNLTLETQDWDNHRIVRIPVDLKPSTSYTITVNRTVKDVFGQTLDKPYTYTFKTDPYTPFVTVDAKSVFGFFEKDKSPVYNFSSVNVSALNFSLRKLAIEEFVKLLRERLSNDDHGSPNYKNNNDKTYNKEWQVKMKNTLNKRELTVVDPQAALGNRLTSGIYLLTSQSPEYKGPNGKPIVTYQFFALTNIALTLKYSGNKVLVWAVDVKTGNPVSGATVNFFDAAGALPYKGTTDINGFFETSIDQNKLYTDIGYIFWVTAEKNGDFSFVSSDWNDGIRPYQFDGLSEDFRYPRSPSDRLQAYIYTDRPIYRTGDTVYMKGIVRLLDWNGMMRIPEKNRQMFVTVNDALGKEVLKKTLPLTAYGTFSLELPVAKDASLGNYSIVASIDDNQEMSGWGSFSVLAYRKPEYQVDITMQASDYYNHDRIQADIAGSYYFGAPMSAAKVLWRVQTTDYFFNRFTDGWYSFALEDNWCYEDCERESNQVAQGSGVLDDNGHMSVSVPVAIDNKGVSQIVSIEADITDQNNQVVSNRSSVPMHKSAVYVGVQMEDYGVTPGQKARVKIVTVKPDGSPQAKQPVTLALYSRTWTSVKEKGVDGEYYYDNQPKDTFVREIQVQTSEQGKAVGEILVDNGGEYRVVASTKDASGRESKAGTSLYAWSSTYINWPHTNSDRIDLIADKREYAVGETANILVKSPWQGKGVKALVTIERENVISKSIVDVKSNALPLYIPITEEMIPNTYVSVVIVKPRMGETFDNNGLDTGLPAYKIGYVKLLVQNTRKKINLSMTTDQKSYIPRQKVTVRIKAADWQGKPVKAELSLGVVDKSVLDLAGFELLDLVGTFYSERGLGVLSSNMLMYFIERYKPGSKGGGGGGSESDTRDLMKDTAYWNPVILTDDAGNATVSFTLPDNLTTWQLLAIGSSKQQTFGSIATTVIESKHVIVRPVLPRFAVIGDEVQLGAIVHNYLETEQTMHVTLDGQGFSIMGSAAKDVTIEKGGQAKIMFPVRVNPASSATFHFTAQSLKAKDDVVATIPVYEYGTPQVVATTGVTEDTVIEKVSIPAKDDASRGSLKATVSPSLATYLSAGLQYVSTYPYGCSEQTMSSLLPNTALKALQGFDAFKILSDKELNDKVIVGVQRIYGFQKSDGGFGYWQESSDSFPYLTAYILYGLNTAKSAGYTVDSRVIANAVSYLQLVLRSQKAPEPVGLATRAYILHVLAENGINDVSLLNNLYDKRTNLPLFSKAQLAMAYIKAGDKSRAKSLLREVTDKARIDSRGTHFEEEEFSDMFASIMHTNDRTTATVLQALVRIKPTDPIIPSVVRSMLESRHDGHWDTTQSTSLSLLALVDYLKSTKELDASYTATVSIANQEAIRQTFAKENILSHKERTVAIDTLPRGKDIDVRVGKDGKGKLYYDLLLQYFSTADTILPAEEGISIQRSIEPIAGSSNTPTVGSTYKVTLTMTVPQDRHFVAVESPHPAGMEGIDFSLRTSQQDLLANTVNQSKNKWWWSDNYISNALWRFSHREFKDDSVFLYADELPAGVYKYEYLVRATSPGHFRFRPARIYEMYFPEVFGQTGGQWLDIQQDRK